VASAAGHGRRGARGWCGVPRLGPGRRGTVSGAGRVSCAGSRCRASCGGAAARAGGVLGERCEGRERGMEGRERDRVGDREVGEGEAQGGQRRCAGGRGLQAWCSSAVLGRGAVSCGVGWLAIAWAPAAFLASWSGGSRRRLARKSRGRGLRQGEGRAAG
jgi:hypothetical protein